MYIVFKNQLDLIKFVGAVVVLVQAKSVQNLSCQQVAARIT